MALVKTSLIKAVGSAPEPLARLPQEDTGAAKVGALKKPRRQDGTRHEKASERIAAATEELARGLSEASAAAEQLRRAMEQIASGAEEAAGASQQQLEAIRSVVRDFGLARGQAETTWSQAQSVQGTLTETAVRITASVRAIEKNAARQQASMVVIEELERRAAEISEITRAVSSIADQTNLLALNAAIEAARAGDQGLGFAVVADEVRTLAETSDSSAQSIRELADTIQNDVREVVKAVMTGAEGAIAEAKAGAAVVENLDAMRRDVQSMAEGSDATRAAATEAERAAAEAQRGAEQVASAAEEQSAAALQAQTSIREQSQSLEQGQVAAQALAGLTEDLRAGTSGASAAEQIGAMAEELSAAIQELSTASGQITAAVGQISRGSQLQAAATQQSSAALTQIEQSTRVARDNAGAAIGKVQALEGALKSSRDAVDRLINGVRRALADTGASLVSIETLEAVSRRIEKVVESIAVVAVKTSMLAVSGAVEAARAGDAGRGFAVVSADIRSLAQEASEAADRIKETARGVGHQIASVRRGLEQIAILSEAEVEKNLTILDALTKMDGEVATLTAANIAIQRGADAMTAAIAETAGGARQIAAAAEEAGNAARQAAAAAAQQTSGAEDLAAAIEEIASLADELRQAAI